MGLTSLYEGGEDRLEGWEERVVDKMLEGLGEG